MSYQGTFDPDLYDPGDMATWPVPAAGPGTLYQPGMWWELDPPGDWDGTPTAPGDRTYVEGRARRMGELDHGDYRIGDPPGSDWPLEVTTFVLWQVSDSPWLVDPVPHAGVELIDGWRVVVELLHTDSDPNIWTDYTERMVSVRARWGSLDGATAPVPVESLTLEIEDPAGPSAVYRPAPDGASPRVGDVARVGFLAPGQTYHALATCRVERMTELHDQPDRVVQLEAFGMLMDTVAIDTDLSRPREDSVPRVDSIFTDLGWSWSPVAYPSTPGIELASKTQGNQTAEWTPARSELDAIGYANGWRLDSDSRGQVRYTQYPPAAPGPVIDVTDQLVTGPTRDRGLWTNAPAWPDVEAVPGDTWTVDGYATTPNGVLCQPGDLLTWAGGSQGWVVTRPGRVSSPGVQYTQDMAELLNRAVMLYESGGEFESRQVEDAASQAEHGLRSVGYGLPWLVAEPQSPADLDSALQALVDHAKDVTHRVNAIDVDTAGDGAWLDVLAALDLGDAVTTHRQGDWGAVLLGQVAGCEHRIDRTGWRATVFLSGFTPATPQATQIQMATTGTNIETAAGDPLETPLPREPAYA